jgi:hypothetical protein
MYTDTMKDMNSIIINVNWEYFLGVMGALIGIAYYTSARFSRIETSLEWIKDTLRDLLVGTRDKAISTKWAPEQKTSGGLPTNR